MSLFGAMTTAISGLGSQSQSLSNISDNIANSQTVGYKRVDTNFVDYLTTSSLTQNQSGTVVARPDYTNSVQGTIQQSDNDLALAIGGDGFFAVASSTGTSNGEVTFDQRQFYTRNGDFSLNSEGYLVNSSGYYLEGWSVSSDGTVDRSTLAPIEISQAVYNPVATSKIALSANLPAGSTDAVTTQAQIYDTLGALHTVTLTFTPDATTNTWTVGVTVPDDVNDTDRGGLDMLFGSTATPAATDGTLGQLTNNTGSVTYTSGSGTGTTSALSFTADFGQGAQTITLDMGTFGSTAGLTQFSSSSFNVRNLTQNGVPLGSYSSISISDDGDISLNYDNGQSRIVARVPVVTFPDADKLLRLDGQAFMATPQSGAGRVTDANQNGAGKLVVGSVEGSNVDLASEFTKLIVAQRAYTANTKVVTASDQMLQDTINISR